MRKYYILILVGSLIALIQYTGLMLFLLYDYYLSGIESPLHWIYFSRFPSAFQFGIFLAVGFLIGVSIYILKGLLDMCQGKSFPFFRMCICSMILAPAGLLSLVGLLIVNQKQIKELQATINVP